MALKPTKWHCCDSFTCKKSISPQNNPAEAVLRKIIGTEAYLKE